jgi:amino acid adenylation domain-containing protein/FkbM family methyltransferase
MAQQNIQLLFQDAVERFPNHVAIDSSVEQISYLELERRANSLARFLSASGVQPGSLVAILAENTTEVVVSIIGILKAGCAFVPLDPRAPATRLEMMLNQVSPRWLLAEAKFGGVIGALRLANSLKMNVVWLDRAGEVSTNESGLNFVEGLIGYENLEPISVPMEPDALCYVYFTSGSTGKPKGIAGRLKGIAHFVRWEIESFDVGAKTRVSQLTTPAFDAFLRDIFTPLCAGGTVCVPEPRESVLDAEGLVRWVESAQLNLIHCVPSVFRLLLGGEISPGHFQSLRHILLAGEPLLPADVKRWTSVFGDRIQLVNLYGPSETTMTKFFYRVSVSDGEAKSVPIGQPMPGARAVVVDERGKICRVGGVGEIYIRTPYCALGYYKEPELTEAVFVANPFDTAASDIVYKTGDIGCLRADGNFELFGRKDNQVKINGVRIELSEIESCLLNHPVIEDAAVVPRTDGRPAPYLCAYVVGHAKVETAALREYLAGHLPPYMLPSSIVVMEALPRTFTGKVNRQALPPPRESRSEYVAPRNQIEELLAGLFSQLLKTDRIGVNDNFFDLGGQSILAMQLLARIKDSFGIDIALRDLFTVADLGGLSRLIETALSRGELQTIKPIVPVARDGEIPLSFSQERFWFLEQLNAGTAAYHVPVAVRINGELRFDALEAALNEIIRRHEALRTGFEHRLGKTVQVIAPTIQLAVRRVDARHLQGDAQLPELHRLYREEISQTFNLGRPPLLRATLFQLSDREHTLLVTMHHIICDAWSLNIFFREVGALYRATLSGEPAPLPPLPIQYADFACWQRSIGDAVADAQLIYWKQQLANLQPLQLPTDRPRPPIPSFRGANQSLSFSPETCAALKALSQQNGVTLFMTLLAAFQSLLSRYTRQSDITVGTPIANRSRTEIEGLIGFFANTLTLHTDFSGDPTFEELLRRVRDIALGAYMHQDVAFEQVVNHVQPERDLSRQPLFQVMFVLQNAPVDEVELPATTLSSFEVESGTAPFDLTVELYEADGCINGRINYSRDLFEAATIERLARHFVLLVEGAVAEPTQRVSALPILTHEERRQLLPTDTLPVYPQSICLHELFEQQVREHPDAIALVFKNERLTYQQLNARANQLAHHLQSLGVGPDVLVALCLDQSLELVVGILGILKAGGAYVPLDPAAPTARLAYVLADTSAKVLLTKKDLQERLPEALPVNTVYLDAEAEILARYADDCPTSGVQPENLAYVIYTSGSTGQPKGVPVEHRNVVRLFEATQGFYQFNSADVWTLFHSYAFDFSVWELWGALLYGGRLVVVPYWLSRSPEAFYELLRAESITVLNQTPSAFWQLVEAEANLGAKQKLALRYVIFGGEALEMRRLKPWFERHGDVMPRLVNMYGITETTVHVTFRPITTDDVDATFSSAIGQPIADLRVYILDEHLQPNPSGVPGELCIGGDGLSRGYLGNPALTAQRFVPDPFSARAGARLYRSGDSARYRNDGDIEYLGRIDRQVKVRGFRIELGEIEASLHQHDEIKEAVVVVREDTPGDKRLVGYVVPEHKQAISLASQQLYRLPNDLEVAYLNKSDTDLLYHELYVERSYFDGGISVNDGDCIFDVGANIGLFTLFINQAFRNTRVYAFEPIPPIFARLSDNVALYNLNVKLFECGLSSQTGTATFTFYPQMTVMSGRYADAGEDEKLVKAFISNQSAEMSAHADELLEGKFKRESFDCRLRTISDVIHEENIERIDLLKIDTEKSEVDVLEGIEDADWKKIKQISLEVHGDERLAQVRAILERHAYHFTVKPNDETEHTGLYNVYALRHSAADNASTGRQENHPASLHTLEKHLLSANELRGYLKDKLPDYMIPATFVLLSELPLTSNGKVDRKALPLPEQARQSVSVNEFAEPQTEAERLLAEIWSQVLGIEHVGVRDSFFSLGGDSILSLQIIARARRVGLHLTPKQLFQHQTIASLAALPEISGANPPAIKAEQGVVSGDVPLTPIQHWFFEQDLSDAHYLNQAIAFESRQALNPALIEQVWRRLIEHHDVLRLRFVKEDEGWRQFIVAEENNRVFSIHDFSGLSADEQASAISTATAELQASLNLTHGPLLRIAYFDLGSGRPSRLLFIIHHLAVDTVSWRILLDDFQTLYRSLASGRVPQLPSKTTDGRQSTTRLLAQSSSARPRPLLLTQRTTERRLGADGENFARHGRDTTAPASCARRLPDAD